MIMPTRPFLASAFALTALALPGLALANDAPRTLTVSGTGSVALVPDMVTVTLGVHHEAPTAQEALQKMSEALGPVLAHLAESGVAERDIQTSGLSLGPVRVYPEGEAPRLTGYTASSTVSVRLRELDAVGAVLDSVIGEGANELSGISFSLADPAAAENEARRAAVMDARARAETYAEAAGVSLGEVQSISESGGGGPMPVAYAMREASVPVAAGEIEISASVTMVYAIE